VDSESRDFSSAGKRSSLQVSQRDETVRGSLLQAGDNLLLTAGRDVNLTAALVDSNDGAVSVAAGRDVNLLSANETHDYSLDSYDKKKKTLSSTTTTRSVDSQRQLCHRYGDPGRAHQHHRRPRSDCGWCGGRCHW
jgi:filamentous hemagglutinin